jgi:hypothetical protein
VNDTRTPRTCLLLDEMEAGLLTAVRTRLTMAATVPCTAHPAGHAVQKTGQDEELDYAPGAADDELLAAIERRTARTVALTSVSGPTVTASTGPGS